MIDDLHDALRKFSLVPEAEDCPFIACSVDYRTKLRQAVDELDWVSGEDHRFLADQLKEAAE